MPISGYFLETWSGKRPGIWVIRSNVHFSKMAGNLGAGNSEKDGNKVPSPDEVFPYFLYKSVSCS